MGTGAQYELRLTQKLNTSRTPARRWASGDKVPRLAKKLFATDSCWETEKSVFFSGVTLSVSPHSMAGSILRNNWQHKLDLMFFVLFCLFGGKRYQVMDWVREGGKALGGVRGMERI